MNDLPLVSVIIPTYNYEHYIVEALDSIAQQNYPTSKIEIIIVDDGSSDGTQDTVAKYCSSSDLEINYVYQENKGKAAATAVGIELAKGKYIFNLDADDYFLQEKIATTVSLFKEFPSLVHVGNAALIITDSEESTEDIPSQLTNKPIDGKKLLEEFYTSNILFGGGSTYAALASTLKSIYFPAGVDMYVDEYLLLAVLVKGDSYLTNEPLSVWRVHGNNYSVDMNPDKRKEKDRRLLQSSQETLTAIQLENDMPKKVVEIYRIKHAVRDIAAKERAGAKSTRDIINFLKILRSSPRVSISEMKRQYAFNRLIPQWIFKLLRK